MEIFKTPTPTYLNVVVADPASLQYGPVVSGGQTHWKPPLLLMQVPPLWHGFWWRHSLMSIEQRSPVNPRHLQIGPESPSWEENTLIC